MILRVLRARVCKPSGALAVSTFSHHLRVHHHPLDVTSARFSSAVAKNIDSAVEANASDPVDNVKIDLGTIGAEKAKVLTIADVLNAREREPNLNQSSFDFEEWESIAGTETVHDAVLTMVERDTGSLIVTEAQEGIVGIITERDILKKIFPRTVMTEEKLVRDVMSSHIMCIHPSTTVIDALATMTKENIRHLAVVNGDMTSARKRGSVQEEDMRCVLSITDIVRAYAEYKASTNQMVAADVSAEAEAHPKMETKGTEVPPASETRMPEVAAVENGAKTSSTSVITAATLLKKKHKRIQLILNTRPEDHVMVATAVTEMAKRDFGAVLVVDKEQRVLGIFTERDYIRKVLFEVKDPTKILVTDTMSPISSMLQLEDSLEKCWNLAATSNCRHFPVIGVMRHDREKELAGILSIKDIVREISKDYNATPGFRLMEFIKSKMEPKRTEQKHAATEAKSETASVLTEAKAGSPSDASQKPEGKEKNSTNATSLNKEDDGEIQDSASGKP